MRVSAPGRLESFDPNTQLASVKILLRETWFDEEGKEQSETVPIIVDVPVQFPGAGEYSLTFPPKEGDPVLVIFADRSIDKWLDTGDEVDPVDLRRHHLTDAFALLGFRPRPKALTGFDNENATIGRDGGPRIVFKPNEIALGEANPTDSVAMNQKVLDALTSIANAFNAHTHTTPSGPSGNPTLAAVPTTMTVPASVGSSTVKVKG
jgi:hypothetical protein